MNPIKRCEILTHQKVPLFQWHIKGYGAITLPSHFPKLASDTRDGLTQAHPSHVLFFYVDSNLDHSGV